MLPLFGVATVIAGFALRMNPLLVVAIAAVVTGLCAGMSPVQVISAFGKAFNEDRYVSLIWLILPLIGLLERYGLQARARTWVGRLRAQSVGGLLLGYLGVRQITSALGLTSLGGPAPMVRPLLAPLAESAAEAKFGPLPARVRNLVRAHAQATDTVGLFFGEDIFIAIGSILLIRGFLGSSGVNVDALSLSLWAIPTAIAAFLIHGVRLLRLDARLRRETDRAASEAVSPETSETATSPGAPAP